MRGLFQWILAGCLAATACASQANATLFTQTATFDAGFPGWWDYMSIPDSEYMFVNESGSTYTGNNRYIPNDSVEMDPEGGTISVVFTAPLPGTYTIAGDFVASDGSLLNLYPVEVSVNNVAVWTENLFDFEQEDSFNLSEALGSGDTITLSVLTGTEYCTFCYLSTALSGTITSPTGAVDDIAAEFSNASNPNGVWSYTYDLPSASAPVPEPGYLILLCLSFAAVTVKKRFSKGASQPAVAPFTSTPGSACHNIKSDSAL